MFLGDLLCQRSQNTTRCLISLPCMSRNPEQKRRLRSHQRSMCVVFQEGHSNPCPQPVDRVLELTCMRSRHSGSLCLTVMLIYNMIFCTNAGITVMYATIRLEGWMASEFVDIMSVFCTKVNCLTFLK
jgi:hypothetical protein